MKKILLIILIASTLQSCGENNTVYKPESSGRINSITVVLDNKSWDNKIGDKIRALYADEFMGLPQIEERFTLKQMPYETFDGFSRTSRNIIFINKNSELDHQFQKNKFANPQIYLEIRGTSFKSITDQLDLSRNEAIRKFSNGEIEENKRRILKSPMNDIKPIEGFLLDIKMPSAYSLYKEEKNFIWYQKLIDKGHSNLIITELFTSKDVFDYTIDEVISLRDSVGSTFLLGRNENSFMITEKEYLPLQKRINYYGTKMLETRGTWEVKGDFMGGPYLNYIVEDKVNSRFLLVEGFVFAPSKRKRDNIIELEAIIKSIKFKKGPI
ncbi:MAG: DUF4837 family protein [Cryomorphaceae bacterium]|nr:MAG: DUF4837 family protein [Cryomorphaceae bacterium]